MSVLRSRRAVAYTVLVGVVAYLWAADRGVPRPIERLASLGGDALARRGGVVMELALQSPDARVRARGIGVLERRLAAFGDVSIEPSGELARVTVTGVPSDRASAATAAVQLGGRLEMALVVEENAVRDAAMAAQRTNPVDPKVDVDVDSWTPEDSDIHHRAIYLSSHDRAALARAIAALPAASGERVVIERVLPEARERDPRPYWRTYVIRNDTWEINDAVARAGTTWDPNTNKPIVQLDFNADGRRTFGELTGAHVGAKLAILLDGEVTSAPIINGPIRGGSAVITMGGTDPDHMQDEADALVSALAAGTTLPFPVAVRDVQVVPPSTAWQTLARVLTALAAMLIAIAIAWPLARWPGLRAAGTSSGRPTSPTRPGQAESRALITLIVLGALVGLHWVIAPGVRYEVLRGLVHGSAPPPILTIAGLGVSPIVLAYLVVELATQLVPSLRARRRPASGALSPGVILLAALFAVIEAWLIAGWTDFPGLDPLVPADARWELELALAAGFGAHVVGALVIDRMGLGRGWSAILVVDVLVYACTQEPTGSLLAAIALIAPLAVMTVRTRIGAAGASVRAPLGGFPGAAIPLVLALVLVPLQIVRPLHIVDIFDASLRLELMIPIAVVVAAALGVLWTRRLAGVDRWRAIALSAGSAAGLFAITSVLGVTSATGAAIAFAAAALADMIVEARARARGGWSSIEACDDVDAADDLLGADDPPRLARGLHVRALLRGLGPMVPVDVLEDHGVPDARQVRGSGGPG
jgi:hypothetical protein